MSRYYYAGGRRVELETDDEYVAVDRKRAGAAGLAGDVERAAAGAPRLPGGVVLARRGTIGVADLARLRDAGALHPVFRRGEAIVVALPEIRIEFDTPMQREAVVAAIGQAPHEVRIAEETPERIVLQPASDSGDEALDVANYVYERARPSAASVRFVQFVPKPETHR